MHNMVHEDLGRRPPPLQRCPKAPGYSGAPLLRDENRGTTRIMRLFKELRRSQHRDLPQQSALHLLCSRRNLSICNSSVALPLTLPRGVISHLFPFIYLQRRNFAGLFPKRKAVTLTSSLVPLPCGAASSTAASLRHRGGVTTS